MGLKMVVARGSWLVARERTIAVAGGLSVVALVGLAAACLRSNQPCTPASLLLTPDQLGRAYFDGRDYDAAADAFEHLGWRAAALYRAGEFERAAGIWRGTSTAEGAFNRGNALVMLGKYDDAVGAYDRALELRPDWREASANRDLAQQRAKWLEKKGGEMTGGKLEADEIVFDAGKSPPGESPEETKGEGSAADERAIWLRQVATKPADFLRARFAYELARKKTQ